MALPGEKLYRSNILVESQKKRRAFDPPLNSFMDSALAILQSRQFLLQRAGLLQQRAQQILIGSVVSTVSNVAQVDFGMAQWRRLQLHRRSAYKARSACSSYNHDLIL